MGTGLLRPYPFENVSLFDAIKERGLLISEHLPNFPGSRIAFLLRNRITSGISNALILVASKETGGAMAQVKFAYEQHIPIFCPPLALNLQPNEGVRQSIQSYGAKEVTSVTDVYAKIRGK